MSAGGVNPFGARDVLDTPAGEVTFYRLAQLEAAGVVQLDLLPYSIRILLEAVLRHCDGYRACQEDVVNIAGWAAGTAGKVEVPFFPARVILQDFTGVPALVDLASMRSAVARLGGDPLAVNPLVPVDLVIDHSVQVDCYGRPEALEENLRLEMERNRERYIFLKWGQRNFRHLRVIPPGVGIIHQVNLEKLATVVQVAQVDGQRLAYPDTLVGTDSHTTMINGIGVVGWGVGGIEAEAVMLGQPIPLLLPEVIGCELVGSLPPGVTATDLVLTITALLRREGVVGKFVEFFGPGAHQLPVPDRATVANMAPEYGATMGFFPPDERVLEYLELTGRPRSHIQLVEAYLKEQGLFYRLDAPPPRYTKVISLDLSTIEPSLAGPKRPHDRVRLFDVPSFFSKTLRAPVTERGYALGEEECNRSVDININGESYTLRHGSVVLAAITSCTITSNPTAMVAAGLVARKAVELGLRVPPFVKTSLAPGSRVVTDYLTRSGLQRALDLLGFHTVGYGCTTCIGNSGPLPEPVAQAIRQANLVAVAVLSGNRNFEARIHPLVRANFLASPPLVVAYALAGRIDIDFASEPIGQDRQGRPVYLRELWPEPEEVNNILRGAITHDAFQIAYEAALPGPHRWHELPSVESPVFSWDPASTYIREAPFFADFSLSPPPIPPICGARVLALLGDSVTTDHISPAGSIPVSSPAGQYLIAMGVRPEEFNSYGARRGNHEVMIRGTFANIRLRNFLVPDREGGYTCHFPGGEIMTIYEAAIRYQQEGVPLVVIAGHEYGSGSSRDWAAKGTRLLGVRAVLAASFERIHRSNLVGMGVLPLQFVDGQTWQSLGLSGREIFNIYGVEEGKLTPGGLVEVEAVGPSGERKRFPARVRIDTQMELDYYRHGGVLPYVLRTIVLSRR
ncbi:MAG: aconitate hydratase AcnA [Thermoguttaceae bacterium]|nr:aconitate hydratase AcnA [Thermoguttaceae bacterium]MDW8078375.1 aconitate hydratase AcnA [Thermoguttaceae bacterium]